MEHTYRSGPPSAAEKADPKLVLTTGLEDADPFKALYNWYLKYQPMFCMWFMMGEAHDGLEWVYEEALCMWVVCRWVVFHRAPIPLPE